MNDIKILLQLASKMLLLANDQFSSHGCNDLDNEIIKLIPEEWCEEARQLNSNGRDPWPEEPLHFGDAGLMWFLARKLEDLSVNLDRDLKLNEILK